MKYIAWFKHDYQNLSKIKRWKVLYKKDRKITVKFAKRCIKIMIITSDKQIM